MPAAPYPRTGMANLPDIPRIVIWITSLHPQIQDTMYLDPRPEFHRVVLRAGDDGTVKAYSTGGQRSSRVASLSGANGLVALPARTEQGPKEVLPGSFVSAVVIGEILG